MKTVETSDTQIKLRYQCPSCDRSLDCIATGWYCAFENIIFKGSQGILNFIIPQRREKISEFLKVYQSIRRYENWGGSELDYYRSLPYEDKSNKHTNIWKVRAKSFAYLLGDINLRYSKSKALILDLGAGNCWLALRLAHCNHHIVAVDLNTDEYDGLGVLSRFPAEEVANIIPIQADFHQLPFPKNSFDIVVFNGSLHYASDIPTLVENTMKFLKHSGILYVVDTPLYTNPISGQRMIQDRLKEFKQKYRLQLDNEFIGSYLTTDMLHRLSDQFIVTVHQSNTFFSSIRKMFLSLWLGREPASFAVIKIQHLQRE